MMLASVVLPTPGGPQKIIEGMTLFFNVFSNTPLSPIRCSCPIKSSKDLGRNRSAKGGDCIALLN